MPARVRVEIIGDTKSLDAAFARAAAMAKTWDARMAATSAKMQATGRSMTRHLTLPIVGVALAATKMAIDFQKNMTLIETQAGASAGEVKRLSGAVLNLAHTAPQGPNELAKGLFHLESLGLRGSAAMRTLKIASTAAGMGIANLEDVTTALGGAVVTGIKGTQNYTQAMGTLNATIGAGNMKMEDLTAALSTGILPTANLAHLSLSEVGAALAVMTDRGMGADEAATKLKMSLAMMMRPTNSAQKALSDLGISGKQMAETLSSGNGHAMRDTLELIAGGMHKVGDKTRAAADVLKAFGGGRSGVGILTLLQSLGSGLSSYEGKLASVDANSKKFAAQEAAYHQTAAYKISAAWSSVQADMIRLGATFAPVAVTLAGGLARITGWLDHLSPAWKKTLGIAAGFLAVLGPTVYMGGKLIKMFLEARTAAMWLGRFLLGLGPAAVEGATVAEGEVAGVGAAAVTAEAEVTALGMALSALGPLALGAAGALAILWGFKSAAKHLDSTQIHGSKPGLLTRDKKTGTYSFRPETGNRGSTRPHAVTAAQAAAMPGSSSIIPPKNTSGMSNDPMHDAAGRPTGPAQKHVDPYMAALRKLIREENARIAAAEKNLGATGGADPFGTGGKSKKGKKPHADALSRGLSILSESMQKRLLHAQERELLHPNQANARRLFGLDRTALAFLNKLKPATLAFENLSKAAIAHMTVDEKRKRVHEAMLAIEREKLTLDRQEAGLRKKIGVGIDNRRSVKSLDLLRGLHMPASERRELAERIAQAAAHNFRVPAGPAAAGFPVHGGKVGTETLKIDIYLDGRKLDPQRTEIRRAGRNARYAGTRPG